MVYLVGETPWIPQVADMLMKLDGSGIGILEYQIRATVAYKAPGVYDFSYIDRDLNRIIALNPNAAILVAVRLDMGPEWLESNPDELIEYADATSPVSGDPMGNFRAPSMASEKFRDEIRACAKAIAMHIRSKEYYKRIVALRVSHGIYSEWHYYGMYGAMPDTGKPMTRRFRQFLAAKYESDEQLQYAWHQPAVTLDTAMVPSAEQRGGKDCYLKDFNSGDMQCLDYYECQQQVIAETLLLYASIVKEFAPKLLVGAYYGYTFCMGYPPEGQTQLLDRILSSPHIDFLSSPYSYWAEARYAGGDGMPRMMLDLFRKYGKLAILEDDYRNYLSTETFMKVNDKAGSLAILKRDISNAWLNGTAIQFLDFDARRRNPCTFNSPEIFSIFRRSADIWQKLWNENTKEGQNDVAVVMSPSMLYLHGYPDAARCRPPIVNCIDMPVHALKRSGIAFDLMQLDTFLESSRNYKAVVFLNCFTLSEDEIKAIHSKVRRKGVTTVWDYAPGLATPDGFSAVCMSRLCGISLKPVFKRLPMATVLEDATVMDKDNWAENPRVYADDKDARIIGRYADSLEASIVVKELPDGSRSVFAGMPIVVPELWQRILTQAGVHAYLPPNQAICTGNSSLLMLHSGGKAALSIDLQEDVDSVTDLYSGNVYTVEDGRLELSSPDSETWLLQPAR